MPKPVAGGKFFDPPPPPKKKKKSPSKRRVFFCPPLTHTELTGVLTAIDIKWKTLLAKWIAKIFYASYCNYFVSMIAYFAPSKLFAMSFSRWAKTTITILCFVLRLWAIRTIECKWQAWKMCWYRWTKLASEILFMQVEKAFASVQICVYLIQCAPFLLGVLGITTNIAHTTIVFYIKI